MSFNRLKSQLYRQSFKGGHQIKKVTTSKGEKIKFSIIGTMMRIDLKKSLTPKSNYVFNIDWEYNIIDADLNRARGGYEYFKEDKNYIYEIAQWFPRMAAYTDYTGWQNKQFLGSGEFTLEFGNYKVEITAPEDHIVAATGELQNTNSVMSDTQLDRWNKSKKNGDITFIVTPEEAKQNQSKKTKPTKTKTWIFKADNVRDFAWASSRKFIWDAKYHEFTKGKKAWAMSFYPIEAEPLWSKYSTESVAHTLDVFSKFTFDYPYPVAISVNGPVFGMEYPMICFNGPRPEKDGTYSESTKNALIGVVIHEVGHNWYYGILGSNERDHAWMDEGLNTYLEIRYMEEKYPNGYFRKKDTTENKSRGISLNISLEDKELQHIAYQFNASRNYDQPLVMESKDFTQMNYGAMVYSKTGIGFHYLKAYLGEELFDQCMNKYFDKWKFKHPQPEDLQNVFQKTSKFNLDWFFEDYIKTTKKTDYSLKKVTKINDLEYLIKLKNVTGYKSPIPIQMINDSNKIISEKWINGFKKDTTFVYKTNAKPSRIAVDYDVITTDYNYKNHMSRASGIFKF